MRGAGGAREPSLRRDFVAYSASSRISKCVRLNNRFWTFGHVHIGDTLNGEKNLSYFRVDGSPLARKRLKRCTEFGFVLWGTRESAKRRVYDVGKVCGLRNLELNSGLGENPTHACLPQRLSDRKDFAALVLDHHDSRGARQLRLLKRDANGLFGELGALECLFDDLGPRSDESLSRLLVGLEHCHARIARELAQRRHRACCSYQA